MLVPVGEFKRCSSQTQAIAACISGPFRGARAASDVNSHQSSVKKPLNSSISSILTDEDFELGKFFRSSGNFTAKLRQKNPST
jgi:hypothetical protein